MCGLQISGVRYDGPIPDVCITSHISDIPEIQIALLLCSQPVVSLGEELSQLGRIGVVFAEIQLCRYEMIK